MIKNNIASSNAAPKQDTRNEDMRKVLQRMTSEANDDKSFSTIQSKHSNKSESSEYTDESETVSSGSSYSTEKSEKSEKSKKSFKSIYSKGKNGGKRIISINTKRK